jgi:hypothetical protein
MAPLPPPALWPHTSPPRAASPELAPAGVSLPHLKVAHSNSTSTRPVSGSAPASARAAPWSRSDLSGRQRGVAPQAVWCTRAAVRGGGGCSAAPELDKHKIALSVLPAFRARGRREQGPVVLVPHGTLRLFCRRRGGAGDSRRARRSRAPPAGFFWKVSFRLEHRFVTAFAPKGPREQLAAAGQLLWPCLVNPQACIPFDQNQAPHFLYEATWLLSAP